MALKLWAEAGVTPLARSTLTTRRGSAFIFIDDATGDNAIIISPGVAGRSRRRCRAAGRPRSHPRSVFVTQLEQPLDAARRALGSPGRVAR
jgi:ribokinase